MEDITINYEDIQSEKLAELLKQAEKNHLAIMWNYFDNNRKHFFKLTQKKLISFYFFYKASATTDTAVAYITPLGKIEWYDIDNDEIKEEHKNLIKNIAREYRKNLEIFLGTM